MQVDQQYRDERRAHGFLIAGKADSSGYREIRV
jgi:hypothetical protein